MLYSEIVTNLRENKSLSANEVTGVQLIMLLQDREIKNVSYRGTVYEINFIPITYAYDAIEINDTTYPTFNAVGKLVEHWVHCNEVDKKIYIEIDNEYYEVILEVMETEK